MKTKRIFSLAIAIIMILNMFILQVFAADSEGMVKVSLQSVSDYPGNTITVDVMVEATTDYTYLVFEDITYDTDSLEFVRYSLDDSELFKSSYQSLTQDEAITDNGLEMMFDNNGVAVNLSGKAFSMQFKIKEGAAPRNTDITLSTIVKNSRSSVASKVLPGTITIKNILVPATGIILNKVALSLAVGENENLIATVAPDNATNKTVTWTSSDSSVASVDNNGKVTAVKEGTAVITATTEEGGFKDTCTVSVACAHTNTTVHPAKVSTCLEQGNAAYTTCNDCGVVVSGSDAKLPLATHNYIEDTNTKYLKSSATCNSKAVYYKSCSVCGVKGTQTFENGGYDSHNHMGETYIKDYKEATCFEEGYTGDTYCRGCNTKLIPGTAIQKNAHNPAAGWTTDNESHWKVCQTAGCGNISDKAAHTGGTATCKKTAVCEVCGVEYGTVNAANHANTEKRNVVEATCTTDGYSGDTYCKDCGVKIADGTIVPAGHKLTKVEEKKATHEADGNIAYYVCQGCDKLFAAANATKEIALEDTVIKKGEHSYSENYKNDAENHWKECDCGSTIEKAAHKFGEWKVTKEATADTKGSRERACSVCGYKAVEEIAAIAGNGEKTSPTTGDASNYILWIALTFVSITGIGFMAVLGRKRREK